MNPALTDDEKLVLEKMLSVASYGDALRSQIALASVTRDWTGFGFFTDFKLPPDTRPLPLKGRVLLNAHGTIGGELCDFILFIDNGYVTMLECFTHEGSTVQEGARIEHVEVFRD